jgi:hypothetical protein
MNYQIKFDELPNRIKHRCYQDITISQDAEFKSLDVPITITAQGTIILNFQTQQHLTLWLLKNS